MTEQNPRGHVVWSQEREGGVNAADHMPEDSHQRKKRFKNRHLGNFEKFASHRISEESPLVWSSRMEAFAYEPLSV